MIFKKNGSISLSFYGAGRHLVDLAVKINLVLNGVHNSVLDYQ